MNGVENDTLVSLSTALPHAECPTPIFDLTYIQLQRGVIAIALASAGFILVLGSVVCVFVSMIRKMDAMITPLRKAVDTLQNVNEKKSSKKKPNTTSCAEEDDSDD